MSWQITLIMIVLGVLLSLMCYEFYIGEAPELVSELYDLKLKVIYILFATTLASSFDNTQKAFIKLLLAVL